MKLLKYIITILMLSNFMYGDYIRDNVKETVYDTTTNIIWSDQNATNYSWIGAYDYCENLDINGSTDWHLPNLNQLFLLADRTKYNPSIDNVFINVQYTQTDGSYWSSTTNMQNQNQAFSVNFYDGRSERKDKTQTAYVRCFREWN